VRGFRIELISKRGGVKQMRAGRVVCAALIALGVGLVGGTGWSEDHWTQPTTEELSMTSLPQVPGAPALYLYREEVQVDHMHVFSVYVRMKILTEGGKKYANVDLKYSAGGGMRMEVTDVEGRTIHPDGTVIPFTGKPYEQMLAKGKEYSEKAKVFTLPDVTVGSIIEYRYDMRWEDNYYVSPQWYVQSELYMRKGHFLWKPTSRMLVTEGKHEKSSNRLAWAPILPPGAEVKMTTPPGNAFDHESYQTLELTVADIPPAPEEDFMPPIASFRYRVLFYYTGYYNQDEFWKKEGKDWSGDEERFIGHGNGVRDAVAHLTAAGDAPDVKLKKIYASVMELDNTDYTREHSRDEDKAQGLSAVKSTDDVLARKRGSSEQLTGLFVSMARAAGMKAYLMAVTSRDRSMFYEPYMNLGQLNDLIAIVEVNGKEMFFDPGERYCPFGHLAWKHTMVKGLRQVDGGTTIVQTPGENYKFSVVTRVANLTLDGQGVATGKVVMTYAGLNALYWRQRSLEGDQESLEHELKTHLEDMLPGGVEVKFGSIDKLKEYEEPLVVTYEIKGGIGSSTGKRLLIAGDLFEGNEKSPFVHEKRETPVVFHFPSTTRDVVRVTFPKNFEAESVPEGDTITFEKHAVYALKSEKTATSVTIRRDLFMGEIFYLVPEYQDLRGFYTKFETKDQEPVVLKVAAPVSGGS
jgi:hypothetical protein